MTTRESLMKYVEYEKNRGIDDPIFIIMVFENPSKELIYQNGKHSGFPDLGCSADMGFYYDLDDAIMTINTNSGDIRETVYDAGFILCHFPGLYQAASTDERMYFVWDEDKQGYFQQEEPEIFRHCAY